MFNIVHGIGEVAGAALVLHPGVPLISFTGETTTGQTIMRSAATSLKGLSMELGGKSPCVIFADADPSDPATEVGALVHPGHYDRLMSYVRLGVSEGARLVTGGSRPAGLGGGNHLAPTVFADVTPSMRIFKEEVFGPVVCVTPFDTEAEAVSLANDTRYGLAAYLWTSDLARAHRVAAVVKAGMTWINSHWLLRRGRDRLQCRDDVIGLGQRDTVAGGQRPRHA